MKNNKKTKSVKEVAKRPLQLPAPETPSPKPFLGPLGPWVIPVTILCALILFLRQKTQLAIVLVVLTFLYQGFKLIDKSQISWVTGFLKKLTHRQLGWLLGFLWMAFALEMLTFPSSSWMAPMAKGLPFQQSYWLLALSWCGMVVLFRALPDKGQEQGLSSRTAHYWVGAAMVAGLILRFYPSAPLPAFYGESYLTHIGQLLYLKDSGDYRNAFSCFMGERDPLSGLFTFFWLKSFPGFSVFALQRFSLAFFDLVAIWVFYLLGKETIDRRVGVFAAVMAAFSKALTMKVVSGAVEVNEPLALALALLFLFRLIRKPVFSHFLQWGAVLALVIFMDPVFWVWAPLDLFGVLVWLFYRARKEGQVLERPLFLMVGTTFLFTLLYFHYNLHAFPRDNGFARVSDIMGPLLPCLAMCFYLSLALSFLRRASTHPQNIRWVGWIAGVCSFLILSFPIVGVAPDLDRMRIVLLDNGTWSNLSMLLERSGQAFLDLFWKMGERSNVSVGDPLFGYAQAILIALGTAYCCARPTWKKWLLFLAILAGASSFIAVDDHSLGNLVGCSAPLFVIAGWGLDSLMPGVLEPWKGPKIYRLAMVLFVAFWVWTAQGVVSRIYHQWAEMPPRDLLVREEALKDIAQGYKVYLGPDLAPNYSNILYKENPVQVWNNSNLIYVDTGNKGPDVVVYTATAQDAIKNQLTGAFPTAQWTGFQTPGQGSSGSPVFWRCSIPFSDIQTYFQNYSAAALKRSRLPKNAPPPPPALFEVRPSPPAFWERRYSNGQQGLMFGLLSWMDRTPQVTDPIPSEINPDPMEVDYRGMIHVGSDGKYTLSWKAENRAKLLIDGDDIFDVTLSRFDLSPGGDYMEPEKNGVKSLALKAGDHRVEVLTLFQRSRTAPSITLHREGTPGEGTSLWSSFIF